jgi:hypothetical protein
VNSIEFPRRNGAVEQRVRDPDDSNNGGHHACGDYAGGEHAAALMFK